MGGRKSGGPPSKPRHPLTRAQDNEDKKKKAAEDAIDGLLFKEAVTRKELARRALEKAAAKAAKDKKEKEKEAETKDH